MDNEMVYWRHHTPVGVKVEEITGGKAPNAKIWREMAAQLYCEYGKEGFREIGHFDSGAPFLYGEDNRISVTHTDGMYAVATLPRTPEASLSEYSSRTSMGIDAERTDRAQVLKIRGKFLSEKEQQEIAADDVKANIIAWTAKEALYKASFIEGLDFAKEIEITRMPSLDPMELGAAIVYRRDKEGESKGEDYILYSYESEGHIVTIAIHNKCATFKKGIGTH